MSNTQDNTNAELAKALAQAVGLVGEIRESYEEAAKENMALKQFVSAAMTSLGKLLATQTCDACKARLSKAMQEEVSKLTKSGIGVEVQRMNEDGSVETIAKSPSECECPKCKPEGEKAGDGSCKQAATLQEALAQMTPFSAVGQA